MSYSLFNKSSDVIGFKILYQDLNYSRKVRNDDYIESIDYSAKKRIKKSLKEGYIFSSYKNSEWLKVYNLIKANRLRKGYNISLSRSEFESHIKNFSTEIYLFGIEDSERELVASAIAIKNNKDSLYIFYWGEANNQEKFSPVCMLARTR